MHLSTSKLHVRNRIFKLTPIHASLSCCGRHFKFKLVGIFHATLKTMFKYISFIKFLHQNHQEMILSFKTMQRDMFSKWNLQMLQISVWLISLHGCIIMSGPTRKDNFKILKIGQKPEIKLHCIYVF